MELMDFGDLEPVKVPVKIGGEDYVLREATGGDVVKWRNFVLKNTKYIDGKMSSADGVAEAEPFLVSLCLYKGNTRVPVDAVKGWPHRIQRALFDRAKEISRIDDEEGADALKKRIASDQVKLALLEGKANTPDGSGSVES